MNDEVLEPDDIGPLVAKYFGIVSSVCFALQYVLTFLFFLELRTIASTCFLPHINCFVSQIFTTNMAKFQAEISKRLQYAWHHY